jgi:hypothetical protein
MTLLTTIGRLPAEFAASDIHGDVMIPSMPTAEQPITPAGLGLQHLPMRAERLAYGRNMHLKRVVVHDSAGPDTVHQFVFGNNLARGFG